MQNKTFYIRTYGCQMNESDSERIAGTLIDGGYSMVASADEADLVVLNTCSIREGAENKVYSDIGRLRLLQREAGATRTVAVAGCVAQQEGPALMARDRSVGLVFGSRAISRLPELIGRVEAGERVTAIDIHTRPDAPDSQVRGDPHRAWVTVMEGCDNHCAFCVVPATRGPEVSRHPDGVVAEVRELAERGYVEVTLLGQNVTSYGKNHGTDFADLLRRLHAIDGIRRIRYTTSHPKDFSDRLMDTLADCPKVARHLHLPLQSGSDRVLARMGRGYTYAAYRAKIERVRSLLPGLAITTDLIVGFPGETEADFSATLDAVREIGYFNLYGFKYSRRPGTLALTLDGHLDDDTRDQRLATLLAMQKATTLRHYQALVGSLVNVLVEGVSKRNTARLSGRLENGALAHFEGDPGWVGSFRQVRVTQASASALIGVAV
ncbi:MAG: tRNA (N6-isopentenyl adenosine(37)-C2)-methylthiotransferase MiaB [Nitrospirae bacterium]|nr:tRNA (N6-isopentenyl adenosine(37)-C2)-methylthiotransferase MiaB [Nitrospirota bacterium]